MEARLTNAQLSKVTNTELHKAWHIFSLLLRIGRPARPTELASRCNMFRASPSFVEYLCSIPNSPLFLTSDLFVTISMVAFVAFGKFISNLNIVAVPRLGLRVSRPKRIWDEVVRTYYRKRKRLTSNFEYMPDAKKGAFLLPLKADKEDRVVLASPNGIQSSCTEVYIHRDDGMSSSMNTQPVDLSAMEVDSGNLDNMMVTTPLFINSDAGQLGYGLNNIEAKSKMYTDIFVNREQLGYVYTPEFQHRFSNFAKFPHIPKPITVERIVACMPHLEPPLLTGVMKSTVVGIEAQIDEINSISRTNLNATSCLEVDDRMIISPVEFENFVHNCKDTNVRTVEERIVEGREEERLINCGSHKEEINNIVLRIDSTQMNMSPKDDLKRKNMGCGDMMPSPDREKTTAHMTSQGILSAAKLPVGKQQLIKSPAKLKIVRKDALNPRLQVLCKTLENSKVVGATTEQKQYKKDKKSISMKQRFEQNFGEKTNKENRGNSKERREKSLSVTPNNQQELKALPNFESFIVEEEEGSGGYGTVYRAQRKSDGITFAIKYPHANANRHHVHNELKMLERFGGKNFVIKYEGSFKSGNSDCLVLEHVDHDRPEVLKREIDVFQLRWYGYCMFRALSGLHKQGIVHRDVKPGNFLFSRKANKGYLIDFNLAMDLHQKYANIDKSKEGYDVRFNHVPIPHANSLPPTKSRKLLTAKFLEVVNLEAEKGSRSLSLPKTLKKKAVDQAKALIDLGSRNTIKSQGADGSGITSAKDATSTRTPSAERLREPMPCQGRKELISLVQEAMQGPNHEPVSVPASKRKRVAAPPGKVDRKLVYHTPMPLHYTGIAVAGAGLLSNKGDGKNKREGPCVGTKGFRAPEVLFRSSYQGAKVDMWSAGVTLLYLMIGRTPFVGDPEQNIKEIAKLRGSEDLWEVAKLHNRESSFPSDLFDIQSLPSMKLRDWCELNTKRPDFLKVIPRSLFDLVDKCLMVNPRLRINAEEALRHEFFAPCHEGIRKQRQLRQGLNLGSGTHPLHIKSINENSPNDLLIFRNAPRISTTSDLDKTVTGSGPKGPTINQDFIQRSS
ncbi:hypothetical protein F0562_007886 [Nyssa sinensis]|uniref:non-specific serine/threonine protein kinase n=1 Tax=Nyssa sinensis TaxID=561372 RepID=A0A5J5A738_9ASTE|nr:hypothetical protein F0562_007886 [Nyssa sinensis]